MRSLLPNKSCKRKSGRVKLKIHFLMLLTCEHSEITQPLEKSRNPDVIFRNRRERIISPFINLANNFLMAQGD